MSIDPTWFDLIVAVGGAIAGWFAKHFMSQSGTK